VPSILPRVGKGGGYRSGKALRDVRLSQDICCFSELPSQTSKVG
jgi:hypothetical protein